MLILRPTGTPSRLTDAQMNKMPYRIIRVNVSDEVETTGDPGMTIYIDGIRMPMIPLSALASVTEYDSNDPHANNDE